MEEIEQEEENYANLNNDYKNISNNNKPYFSSMKF